MKKMPKRRTILTGIQPTSGETIEQKVARAKRSGELIRDTAEIIYTPRSAGVIYNHDPRSDKWEIRGNAKNTLDVDKLSERLKVMNKAMGLNEDGSVIEPDGAN